MVVLSGANHLGIASFRAGFPTSYTSLLSHPRPGCSLRSEREVHAPPIHAPPWGFVLCRQGPVQEAPMVHAASGSAQERTAWIWAARGESLCRPAGGGVCAHAEGAAATVVVGYGIRGITCTCFFLILFLSFRERRRKAWLGLEKRKQSKHAIRTTTWLTALCDYFLGRSRQGSQDPFGALGGL